MPIEDYKDQIISIIKKYVPECKVYLFGSRAKGSHYEGSDIDLAIESDSKIKILIISRIKSEINEESNIPFFVDIVDIKSADANIMSQINKDKISWNN